MTSDQPVNTTVSSAGACDVRGLRDGSVALSNSPVGYTTIEITVRSLQAFGNEHDNFMGQAIQGIFVLTVCAARHG